MDERRLICPYCGVHYQARDSVCPRCGKALSPTGYSRYGGPEMPEQPTPPVKPAVALIPPARTRVAGIDRPRTRDAQIQSWRYYLPIAAFVLVIVVLFLNSQSHRTSIVIMPPYSSPVALHATPTSVRPFACLPPPEATEYQVMPDAVPSEQARLPEVVGTMAYLPITGTPTPPPAALRISYILTLTTTKGVLQAKMYDIGASVANLPPVDHLRGALSSFGDGLVTIFTGNTITADFTPTDIPYGCGSVLMLVNNGRVGGDQLTIIRSNDPASALAFTKKYGFTYTVVGQLISGYDVLGALNAGDIMSDASSVSSR